MAVCESCGSELPPGARFCPACGASVGEGARPAGEERKVITVLFADLVGFTSQAERLDPEDVRATLSPYHARLRAELERFGGTVEKFIGDAVMALFGAPVAHEDDPERAVRAALAIRDAIAELNEEHGLDLRVRIAVNTGEAVVAVGARPSEGEAMAAGDVVNTCSRLEKAAPVDGVLVGETTYRATRDVIEYREAAPVHAKGKAEPLRVWEAVAPRADFSDEAVQRPRMRLVGRSNELNLLLEALARARRQRSPQLVTLVGVPGIGKSRLVYELAAAVEAGSETVTWRRGRSLPYGEGVTFWALAEMVKAQAGILRSDGADVVAEKLGLAIRQALPDPAEAEWAEGHLRPLIGLAGQADQRPERRSEAFAAWRRFVEALAEQDPLVLVFEDLHWADDGLLDFVDHLGEWVSGVPLLVVCTARPDIFERRPGWGGGKPNASTVSLGPLTERETALLVAGLLEQAVLPADVQTALLTHAEGNPLYAEEYVRMLIDRGFLRRDALVWRLERADDLPLPESVQGIIAARLDGLLAEEKALLQDAAIVGKVFWPGAIAAVGDTLAESLEERLHALERRELIRRERRSSVEGETEYSFRHALVREVAHEQIPRARRAEKHALAAAWIESLAAGREDHAEMRAHHYLEALQYARLAGQDTSALAERARFALREAGDRASSLSAFGRAWRFYEAALELWPDEDAERPHVLFRYGKALFHAEEAGKAALAEAQEALLAAGDAETAAEAQTMLGALLWMEGARDRAFAQFEQAMATLEHAPASRSKAYVLSNLARFLMAADEAEEAIRLGSEALQMAEELGLDELRAQALTSIGFLRLSSGDSAGLGDLEQSIEITEQMNSPESLRGYLNLGSALANLGDLRRAFEVHAAGRRAAERFGDARGIRWFTAERLYECYWQGHWDEAIRLVDDLVAERGEPHYAGLDCALVRGWIRLARADQRGALADAADGLAFAREAKAPQALFPALAFGARANLAAGRDDDASALADELVATWAGSTTLPSFWTADLATVLAALGRGPELVAASEEVRARTPWLEAAGAAASSDFERAAELYAEIGSLPDEAFARLRAAEGLYSAGRSGEADAELVRSLAFYRRVGAVTYVGEGEALLAGSAGVLGKG